MTTKIGTASSYLDLLKIIDSFLTDTGHAWGLTFSGTGNGRLRGPGGTRGGYIGTADSVTETITITFTSAVAADVVGSISGPLGEATVGADFASDVVAFRIVAGTTPFAAGDVFRLNTGPAWQRMRFGGCPESTMRSGTYSNVANLFDGNTSGTGTIVTATTLPQSVTVEMAVPTAVRSLAIWSGNVTNNSPRDFTLEWSDNGTSWTAAQAFTGASWSTTYQRRDFVVASDPGAHLFWRIRITASNSGNNTTMAEIRLFNDQAGKIDVSSRLQFAYIAPGVDGTQEIFYTGWTYTDTGTDIYNACLQGVEFWHDRTLDVTAIPGSSGPKWWYLGKVPIAYWIVVNGGRLIVVTRISSIYQFIYHGFGLPYETPDVHRHPLVVAGVSSEQTYRYDATGNLQLRNPSDPMRSSSGSSMSARMPDGGWGDFANRVSQSSNPDGSGAGVAYGKVWPWVFDEAGNYMPTDWRNNIDGTAPTLPAVLFWPAEGSRHPWGELDGVYWTSGFDNSPEAILRDGAIDLLVVTNVYRTGLNHFTAIALD